MNLDRLGFFFHKIYPVRWLASIALLFLLDIGTYMAFSERSGPQVVENQDKVMHIVGFFGLFCAGHVALHFDWFPARQRFARLFFNGIHSIWWLGYGVFIEAVQYFLSYRSASYGDLLADVFGILLGLSFVSIIHLYPRSPSTHGKA